MPQNELVTDESDGSSKLEEGEDTSNENVIGKPVATIQNIVALPVISIPKVSHFLPINLG